MASDRHQLVRMLRCVRGEMTFALDIAPRFDYGREAHEFHAIGQDAVVFEGAKTVMSLRIVREPEDERLAQYHMRALREDLHAELTLVAGQSRGVILETGQPEEAHAVRVSEVWQLFDETVVSGVSWLAHSTYTGRWREALHALRSRSSS